MNSILFSKNPVLDSSLLDLEKSIDRLLEKCHDFNLFVHVEESPNFLYPKAAYSWPLKIRNFINKPILIISLFDAENVFVHRSVIFSRDLRKSSFQSEGVLEIGQVFTNKAWRQQGLAELVCRCLITAFSFFEIHWVCREANYGSINLAKKLGFTKDIYLKRVRLFGLTIFWRPLIKYASNRMATVKNDKNTEMLRYDCYATLNFFKLKTGIPKNFLTFGSEFVPYAIRHPYLEYEASIISASNKSSNILELGSGEGLHTFVLLLSGGIVTGCDISRKSLELSKLKYEKYANKLNLIVTDIENLPFSSDSFDIVTAAGALSYGDSNRVANEIFRVLKPGGIFICVDSLNNNFIFRFNRFILHLMGRRSASTLVQMPDKKTISIYKTFDPQLSIKFYGGFVWLIPLLRLFINEKNIYSLMNVFDNIFNIQYSSFKFVMICKKQVNLVAESGGHLQ